MKQFNITGMSCAACSARVEKAVSTLKEVDSCSVSLITGSMNVSGTASEKEIITAVENAGYSATVKSALSPSEEFVNALDHKKEIKQMMLRLATSTVFLIPLMYISMGHNMLGLPLPKFLLDYPIFNGFAQMLLSLFIMLINRNFFVSGLRGALRASPNMDTLVSLGSAASFGYSLFSIFNMWNGIGIAEHYLHQLYFESAAMILVLITVGKLLEAHSKGKTTDALKSLIKLSPKTVTIYKDGIEATIAIEKLKVDDIFIVHPGESIAADGVVIEGGSSVNESALTGESIPVDKAQGDRVTSASINLSGILKCRAERVGEDTFLSQIIKMVSDASSTKAPIAKIADKISGIFVPIVIAIALVTIILWLISGQTIGFAIARGVSVLVISCPCALGLATPVAIMVGNGKGARSGILFKTAEALEKMGKITVIAFDKTGTITKGEPKVTDIIAAEGFTEKQLFELALSLEANSEHPLAKAIISYGSDNNIIKQSVSDFEALPGNGLMGKIGEDTLIGGSLNYVSSLVEISESVRERVNNLASKGKTVMLFCKNDRLYGIIAVADTIKDESATAVRELQNMGVFVTILTGDNSGTAEHIGSKAGVDAVAANLRPNDKADEILKLRQKGLVAMVGDGINDAPALACADVGIAIGAGTDVAIDVAEIVLLNSSPLDVVSALRLSRETIRIIGQNLFWAFFYNVIGIPLAAGAFISLFGWQMNPMFGAAAMSISSLFVVSNALRLNAFDIKSNKRDRKRMPKIKKENTKMQKTLIIEGMMCVHCQARVKKTLEDLEQVAAAEVSYTEGKAVVTLNKDISDSELKRIIEEQDYKVLSFN